MKKNLIVLFLVVGTATYGKSPFIDVSEDHWASKAIENLIQKDIWKGNSDIFQGKKDVTRYEFAYYLSKTLNKLDLEKADREDLVILENLVQDFAKELNRFGFDTDFYKKKIEVIDMNITQLQEQVLENQQTIEELRQRVEKLEK